MDRKASFGSLGWKSITTLQKLSVRPIRVYVAISPDSWIAGRYILKRMRLE